MTGLGRWRRLAIGLALLALIGPAHLSLAAGPDVTAVRSGDHPGFGRIVIAAGKAKTFRLDQSGDQVVVHFTEPINLDQAPPPPRNVLNLTTSGSTASFVIAPGAQVRPTVISNQIVFDILDPPSAAPPAAAATPIRGPEKRAGQPPMLKAPETPIAAQATPPASRAPEMRPKQPVAAATKPTPARLPGGRALQTDPGPEPLSAPATDTNGTAPQQVVSEKPLPPAAPIATAPAASPVVNMPNDSVPETLVPLAPGRDVLPENAGPVGLLARRIRLPKGIDGSAFLVPFAEATGAAAFQVADSTFVAFDERRPIDMAVLQSDPIFGRASVRLLQSGTLLKLPVPAGISVVLSQTSQGWRIAGMTTVPKVQPIAATFSEGSLTLGAEQPSDVISMADPDTGATLLVGTQHRAGQGVAVSRRTTEFELRTTSLGVVVEPLSDAISLKVLPAGFGLTGGPRGLFTSPQTPETDALMRAAHLTHRLDFSVIHTEALVGMMTKQMDDAALAPPRAKGPRRRAVAPTMIALGMAAEAEGLLGVAAEEDPQQAASAEVTELTAIAALLAGRLADADGLNDPRLTGTDDVALWRAVRQAMQDEGSPAAAAVFASTVPLALLYPKPIRDQILPLIIETMIQGGEIGPAARLLAERKGDPTLDYARALQRQAEGDTDHALEMLDALADGHDRFDRARASVRAVELRLSAGKIDPKQAADALDKLVLTWRGDQRELSLRERIADLRGQAGDWRVALSTLRQAESDFPEQAAAVRDRLKHGFASMIAGHGLEQMPPIDVVAAIDENADLMPANGSDPVLEEQLAERVLALDLPDRARPLLQKLMNTENSPGGKARFGASLAALESREKDDAGALAALDASDAHDLPADLVEKRTLLRATSMANRGDTAAAVALLAADATPAATEARATILEQAKDWPGAERAWSDYAASALPEVGNLDEGQSRTLLRLTTAAARAADNTTLAGLRAKYNSRISAGPLSDMFRLLTAEPVLGTGDLGRAKKEVSLAQQLPTDMKALDGAAPAR